jgi:hypothetical protein
MKQCTNCTTTMIDERYIELINKELDGFNTEAESKELEEYLSDNGEALQYYDELLRTASALKRVEEVEPPSFLKTHILNSVSALPAPTRSGFGWVNLLLDVFRQRPVARYAVVFASGLCAGILLLVVADQWRQDEMPDASKVGGSMVLPREISSLQKIDSVVLDGSGFRSMFKTLRGNKNIAVECTVTASENLRIELSADLDELKFVGVNRMGGTDNDVMATGGRVIFTGTKSEHGLITFADVTSPQQPIEVRIYRGGTVIGSGSVRTY